MNPEDGLTAVTCVRCDDLATPVVGSYRRQCSKCTKDVWISPATLKIQQEHDAIIICMPCTKQLVQNGDLEAKPMPPTESQIDEFHKSLKDSYVTIVMKSFSRMQQTTYIALAIVLFSATTLVFLTAYFFSGEVRANSVVPFSKHEQSSDSVATPARQVEPVRRNENDLIQSDSGRSVLPVEPLPSEVENKHPANEDTLADWMVL